MIRTRYFELDVAMATYVVAWISLVIFAAAHLLLRRADYGAAYRGYGAFLLVRWKVVTFLIATVAMTVIAPYTGDPTWDYVDAPMMAILTFATAPWSVGVIYRWRRTPVLHVLVAAVLWMLSASWCYDLYQLLLHGFYPVTWVSNIFMSSVLYFSAGLMWNLDIRPGRGATFAFLEEAWLVPPDPAAAARILLYASPFMLIATVLIGAFLLPY
ncbi:MAG: hypothetical protein ACKVQQ_08405 [Burkholderiales bacterium]